MKEKYENGSILLEVAFTIFSLFIQFGEIGPLSDIHPYLSFPVRYLLHSLSAPKWLLFIDPLFFSLCMSRKHEQGNIHCLYFYVVEKGRRGYTETILKEAAMF